ncbi:MAG: hypothetical protein Q7U68_02250 [Candidatus Roizmanbacteria bacterium]|nr:hypothetical protein [Candidatus Roizmanbacteria bacterium]
MIGKIIKIIDKIVAIVFLLFITLAAMLRMDKPEWIMVSVNWFIFTYLIIKFVLLEKGKTRSEAKTLIQQVVYIFDRLLVFEQIIWWSIAAFGRRGEEFTYLFIIWILEVYLFGKYILLKKPKEHVK